MRHRTAADWGGEWFLQRVRFRELRCELERAAACNVCISEIRVARIEVRVEHRAAIRDTGVCERISGIDLDRLVEHLPGEFETLLAELVKELPAAEVAVVCLDVDGRYFLDRALFVFT